MKLVFKLVTILRSVISLRRTPGYIKRLTCNCLREPLHHWD